MDCSLNLLLMIISSKNEEAVILTAHCVLYKCVWGVEARGPIRADKFYCHIKLMPELICI